MHLYHELLTLKIEIILIPGSIWMNLEDVILIEVSKPLKDAQCGQVIDAESEVVAVICGEKEE